MIGQQIQTPGGASFAPYAYQPYVPQMSPSNPTPQPVQQNQSIQNTGVIVVRNENEAKTYPVGPGYSVTFKNENEPYLYTKTVGFNQLEPPVFKRYLLVEEEEKEPVSQEYEINILREQIEELRELVLKSTKSQPAKKSTKEDSSE